MQIIRHYHRAPASVQGSVIALGNFDGVHRGHHTVISAAKSYARETGVPCAVMTFEPHPLTILKPDLAPLRITSFASKMRLLEQMGVDAVFALPFTADFSKMPAEQFIDEILVTHLQVRHVVTGYDFIFGHGRTGNAALLREKATACGFGFTQIDPVLHEGIVCSSSKIRQFLREGNVRYASAMLGHPYQINGRVLHGQARGRTIGFPTANIALHDLLRPALGVYAVRVEIEGSTKIHNAIANLGNKPTFNHHTELLEVHLFDFDGNIYGKRVKVSFMEFIRPERVFAGLEALKAQIEIDCAAARTMFDSNP